MSILKLSLVGILLCTFCNLAFSQVLSNSQGQQLELYAESNEPIKTDWLIDKAPFKAKIYRSDDNKSIILSNGIISRTTTLSPNAATTSLKVLDNNIEFIRAIKPEAVITIDGFSIDVGGLQGQPNLAFLYPDWIENLSAKPLSFSFTDFKVGTPEKRFDWQKGKRVEPGAEWPPKGVKLEMNYRLKNIDPKEIIALSSSSSMGRKELYADDFTTLSDKWELTSSTSHERSSFTNEGKPGEIYTPNNSAVFAECKLEPGTGLIEASINVGTDLSGAWGPGIALVWKDRIVKFNVRPGNESGTPNKGPWMFTVFDGRRENTRAGGKELVDFTKVLHFRIRIDGSKVICEARPSDGAWKEYHSIDFGKPVEDPIAARVGKLGKNGSGKDHDYLGDIVRLTVNDFAVYGHLDTNELKKIEEKINTLKDLLVTVNYEMYDHVPVISKWLSIKNESGKEITINNIVSEYLGIADHDPERGYGKREDLKVKPNIHFETDYAFDSGNGDIANRHVVHWIADPDYETQSSWFHDIPNVMKIFPDKGYAQKVEAGQNFESIRTFMLPFDSFEKERKGLALRKMYRTIAPWVTENVIMFHLTKSGWENFKQGVDQSAELGFEMLNFSFGSGFNPENESEENYNQMKKYSAYGNSKDIQLGTYSLLASRRISEKDDVINPKTGKRGGFSTFNNSPCLGSEWGQEYFRKMYRMFEETGFKTFTHDGSYPGDICASHSHPGHEGLEDSQYSQWKTITDYYKWCKSKGVYLRVPDFYYLSGSNQCMVPYREANWSLPRRHQLIHTRQNIYDATWTSLASMRWSFVPLSQYQGGGEDATIEPLHQHLDHYEMMLVSSIGFGVQSVLRGPRLYDTEETKATVKRVIDWFKKYRNIIESDIIHLRRPDGRDIDYMLHVNHELKEKGFLMVFNPTDKVIKKKIMVPLYYTGITKKAMVREQENNSKLFSLNRDYEIEIEVEVQPNWYNWYVIE